MKKYFLQAALLVASMAAFGQNDENSSGYKAGYWIGQHLQWIIVGIILIIVLWVLLKKKKPKQ